MLLCGCSICLCIGWGLVLEVSPMSAVSSSISNYRVRVLGIVFPCPIDSRTEQFYLFSYFRISPISYQQHRHAVKFYFGSDSDIVGS